VAPFTDKPDYEGAAKEALEWEERQKYKGFRAPAGMSSDQEGRWQASIDEQTAPTIPEPKVGGASFGDPTGIVTKLSSSPEASRTLLETGSMLPVGQVIQAGADAGVAGMDLSKGDYLGAGISAAAIVTPFTATVLKKMVGTMRPSAAKEVAQSILAAETAGVKPDQPATQTLAAREWAEKGTDSPFFRTWSEDLPVLEPRNVRRTLVRSKKGPWGGPDLLQDDLQDSMEHWWGGSGSGRHPTRLDEIAAQPTVWRLHHHASRGFEGDAINLRASADLGFHMGTKTAAADRALAKGHPSSGDASPPPPTLEFFFKAKKLVPLLDGWDPEEIADEALEHALRMGDLKAAKVLEDLSESPALRPHIRGNLEEDRYAVIRRTLRQLGYDGAVYVNTVEAPGSLSFISFSRLNVKAAAPSKELGPVRGTFDPADPRLAHGVGVPAGIAMREKAREEEGE